MYTVRKVMKKAEYTDLISRGGNRVTYLLKNKCYAEKEKILGVKNTYSKSLFHAIFEPVWLV